MLLASLIYLVRQKQYFSVSMNNAYTINVTRFLEKDLLLQMEKQ